MTLRDRLAGLPSTLRPFAHYALVLLAFFIPIHVRTSINLIAVVLALALIVGNWQGLGQRLRCNWPVLAMWAFWLMHVIGIAYSSDVSKALTDVVQKLSFMVMPIIFMLIELDERKRYNICSAFLLGSLVSMLIMLGRASWRVLTASDGDMLSHFIYCELTQPFHPTFFAMYLALALAIALQRLYDGGLGEKWRVAYTLLALLLLAFCYLTTSRAGIFVMLVALIFITMVRFKYGRSALIAMGGAGMLVGIVALVGVMQTGSTDSAVAGILHRNSLRGYTNDTQHDARLQIWSTVPMVLKGHWLLGIGPGDSNRELAEVYTQRGFKHLNWKLNAHNQYLQTSINIGLAGLALLVIILAYPFVLRFGQMARHAVPLAFIAIMVLHFMFDTMLEFVQGIMFFAFFYSLFFCSTGPSAPSTACSQP